MTTKPSQPLKSVTEEVPEAPVPAMNEQQRLQACGEAIAAAFAQFGCELRVEAQLTIEGKNVVVAHPVAQIAIKP